MPPAQPPASPPFRDQTAPLRAPLQIDDLEREYFDRAHPEHLSGDVLDVILSSLLALFPEAPVSALTDEGIMIPMPASVRLARNPVLEARAGLDLLVFDERLVKAWDRVLAEGSARCQFAPAGHPEITGTLYMLDLRETHEAIVTVAVYDQDAFSRAATIRPELLEAMPRFATVLKDARGIVVQIDEAVTKILGWSSEEMVGHRSIEFIHPDDTPLAIDNWMQMLAVPGPGRRVRMRHRRKDGSWVWFEVTNHNQLAAPERAVVVAEMVDISDEMAAHEELRAREQLLDRLAEATPVGLLQFDSERTVVYTNDRLHQILGVERMNTVDAQLRAVLDGDWAMVEHALGEVLADGRQADVEVQLRLPASEEPRFCAIGLRALSDDAGTISGAIACVTDVTDSARLREELQRRATFDALTGCHNRASVMLALSEGIAGGGPDGDRAVVFVDVDGFKQVNDRYSHAVGDEVLSAVAARLRRTVRDGDMVGRIGGDEFLVVCPSVGSPEQAMHLAERMAAAQREDVRLPCGRIALQVSLGVAFARGHAPRAETLVALADHAMYESKRERLGRPKLAAQTAGASHTDARAGDPRIRTAEPASLGEGLASADGHAAAVALRASNVSALACALHARDHDTEDHSRAVLALALAVGCELGLGERELLDLETVALLHDIGKIGICDAVLRKPGKLSEQEWAEMRRHPDIGADILAAMPSLSDLAPVIRAEHERWDGCGYPNGLRGEEIPLLSRIVFVCDAYHAMTSDRPYRRALAHAVALCEIESNAGSQFCPRSAAALTHVLSATGSRAKPARARGPARARARRTVSQAATR